MAAEAAGARYRRRIDEVMAGRDPLDVMAATEGLIADLLDGTPPQRFAWQPPAGGWAANEIVGHLVDAERVFGMRLRHILFEHDPVLPGWDQEAWVENQHYIECDPHALRNAFGQLRLEHLPIWRGLTPTQLERAGRHATRGRETLAEMRRITAGHDLLHVSQLRRVLDDAARANP